MNRNILNFLFIVSALICLADCYMYMTEIKENPSYPGQCYSTDTKKAYNVGESYQKREICEKLTCRSDLRFSAMGCGVNNVDDPNCHEIKPDLTLAYPDCCDKYECTDEQGNKFRM